MTDFLTGPGFLGTKATLRSDLTLVLITHSIEEAAVVGQKILVLGPPPNRGVSIVQNPGAAQPSYRETPDYAVACHNLRTMLECQ